MSHFLPRIAEAGFAGVINYPTVAVIDGRMRADSRPASAAIARGDVRSARQAIMPSIGRDD